MTSRIVRPFAVAALALSAGALSAGTATAAPAATPVSGSVEVCTGIPIGQIEISFCL
ncbi:hypothetical protein [Nocardia xishanensis]|uniref:hypothetical protein n=1 Tax=Nocardia xishanensis TaxID=238964 RepID=UPI000B22A859|nr:hypothetical protein [Nocardia xishanensis]